MKTKEVLLSLLFLAGVCMGAWSQTVVSTLEQDADGYYRIGTVDDWQAFATLVVTNSTANARMTADIDLGECQAMLGDCEHEGSPTYAYQGTFDGQGHTLTVHYTGTSQTAPFAMLQKATIRNIHVDGTINNTSGSQPAVIARVVYGTTTVENVWSSVITTDSRTDWDEAAAFVGCVDGYKSGHLVMRDCLFTGTVNSSGSYNGCFVGYINSGGSATVSSCLSLGTFNYTGGSYDVARGTYTNCFVKQWPGTIPASMQITDEQLASGEIAYKLQAGRGKMFWGQTIGEDAVPVMTSDESKRVYRTASGFSNNPEEAMLQTDDEGYYLLGSLDALQAYAAMVNDGFSYVDARMTADIDLGEAQTMIGSSAHPFGGVFDGQGHTLTVNYVSSDTRVAPFWYITGATIRNLHTAGTMQISGNSANSGGGIAGFAQGINTIEHCHSSVNIAATGGSDSFGGIVGVNYRGTLTIKDCIFDGSIVTSAKVHNGGFVGYTDNGTTTATNCLLTATFDCGTGSNTVTFLRYSGTVTNCFYLNGLGVLQGTQITNEQLASGEIAYKLQAGRGKLFWGQTIGVDSQPVLTNDESKRVYRTLEGFSNTPEEGELQIDDDGYYLLGNASDWKRFALLIDDGFSNVNAKMTADIDLGDDQTMIGNGHYNNVSYRKYFSGIFDGQGHTLTVHYVTDEAVQKMYTDAGIPTPSPGYYGFAPFVYVWGGTIRNLHTAGTITATHEGVAGIVGWTNGSTLIERCHSSVDITYTNGARGAAGLTYNSYNDNHVLTINDCIYDGTLTAGTNKTGSSGFVVYSWAGITNISNSLLTATFANGMGSSDCATFVRNKTGNISNSYFLNPLGTIQGNQITADELANGKVAFYLQNGRTDLFWGQAIGTDPQPVLTNDESKRVYRSADGYTNNPAEAIEDQSIVPLLYTRNSNNELTITGFDPGFTPPANYQLVIPDDIDGAPVVAIADAAFRQKTNFTSLYIGKNVASIGTNAFRQCTALTAVVIPKSVTSMGTSVFEDCTSLTSAAFEDGFTMNYIPDWTFYNTRFTSFTIPASVQTINKGAFSYNTALAAIDFPATVTKLGEEAFRNCSALSVVTIPATITAMDRNVFWNSGVETADVSCAVLGQGAFYQCAKLESVTLNEGVTNIGVGAFHGCTKLPAVTISTTVTVLQENAFRECTLLGTVNFTEGSQLTTIGPTAFYVDTALPDIDIPATVTTIGNSAFRNCSKLVTVNIPANTQLTTIGSYAFADCALLPTFTIPNTVTTLADRAFYNCPKLQTVTFSNQLTAIQDETFRKCTLLDNVTIPKSVTHLGSGAFRECTSLVSIVIPNTITTMGTSLFEDCTGLTSVTYEDGFTMNYIPDWTFYNTRFTSFTIPASVQTINKGAFSYNTALAAIDFPATVTKLGEEAFRNCSALSAVTIPATITAMDRNVFWNSGVETADVSCAVLAQGAFYQCAKLESVTLNEGVTSIGVGAFHGCSILPEVTIPKTVTVLSENAFRECPLLETVTFENGIQLESIGNHAFRSCAKLNNVVLPGSLRLVGEWAFSYCTALENLTVEEGVAVISRDAFQYSGMKNVVLPSTLDFIGVNLFYQCNQLETLDLSKCVNVWELYSYTALRGGSYNITYGVPATTTIIMPPYTQATLGANDEEATIDFNLTKDEEDYYLIDTADDWDKFVAYSRAYPNVNGRITADLDLTTHQGKLGVGNGESNYITYQGTLDGQGHTLTISYKNGKEFTGGLLAYVENATVKNLHVQGAVNVYYRVIGGIVGFVKPGATLTMQDCESDIDFTVTPTTTNMHVAGFIGQGKTGIITLTDCLYNGTITGVSSFRYAAPFMGWMESAGRITYNDCLNNGTFVNTDKNYTYALGATQSNGQSTAAVCYFKAGNITNNESLATATTAEQLASGMITYRLQGSREEQHWGQKIGTDPAPRLTNEDGTRVYRGQTYTNEYVEYAGLQKDADDYYLIAGTADWEEFCLLIEDFPLSNARMTADVEVADNSLIGTSTMPYSGIFDGQGHTLTVNYTSMDNYCAPFNYINGATIQNLHTTGQITIGGRFGGGIVASSKGTSTMQNCWSSVNIVSSYNGDATHGGLVAYQENGDLTINNCLFDGSIVGEQSYRCGGLVGYRSSTLTLSNSLCVPTSIMVNEYDCGTLIRNGGGTVTNCYFTQSLNNRDQGTRVTDEQLASGYVTYKLQNKSDELVWAQTIGTDEHPQLVVFNPTALRVYRALEGFSNDPDQAALSQDTDGYYLIGTVNDWKMLAMLVEDDEVDAKARMTADINLGDDQTMIGSGIINDNNAIGVICYQGIFDGQGHTLTVNYTATENVVAPFRYIKDATIKNLRVRGTIATAYKNAGGIVGYCVGQQIHSYIVNCISSVNIVSSFVNKGDAFYDASHHGGIISGILYYGQLHIDDCIFNGSISGETKGVTWGGMVGFPDGTVTLTNCLQAGTFDCSGVTSGSNGSGTFSTKFGNGYASFVNVVNCHYLNQLGNAQGTKATAETLADGTVTAALQAGRAEEIWTQYASMPMLKLFAADYIPGDANGDGEVNISDAVAIVNYILGNPSLGFNAAAADMNGDGKVTISDAVGVVNMVLNQ